MQNPNDPLMSVIFLIVGMLVFFFGMWQIVQ
ncbi:hypothetical protein C7387_0847 [Yokenella regensburgei]|jgi:hypothetical protein|uniref:Protein MgtR n=1 Tax=Yokenella regensburgei TaxID=158877 RepID=A0AB38G0L1_9ENTR|nr:hypothetical protein FHR25_003046 [Yokenella regensburgei]RKR64164.1 hypothetical protein C7387_0847 [Yokenella regensburgei]SQA65228.1 Uncharacterised protein [Yokenella regensburgei]SQA66461.1 Uncharacterised protein [Yokenella regensburgei]SUQ05079.1 Uncharacterised protein [Yokenella regensburgei]